MKRIRIGNIEVRPLETPVYDAEIVKWQPNRYYEQRDEYEQSELDPDYYRLKGQPQGFDVHKSCFDNPESCYVVAFVQHDDGEEPDILTVGSRPWRLDDEDRKDLDTIIRYIFNIKK